MENISEVEIKKNLIGKEIARPIYRSTLVGAGKYFLNSIKKCCRKKQCDSGKRIIHFNNVNETKYPNIIKNHRYNVFMFVPLVIFEQMKFFSNQFYVCLLVSQFFDSLKVGFILDFFMPILVVFTITFVKEGCDDYYRHKRDKEDNHREVLKLTSNGKDKIPSKQVKVGDILQLNKDERVPADMIVLKSWEKNGSIYIKTDHLDGETDWKLRKALSQTQNSSDSDILSLEGYIEADQPSNAIYDFNGIAYFNNHGLISSKLPLFLENTIWADSVLTSEKCTGIVVYTGKETRAQMNSSTPHAKIGILDLEVNLYNKILFGFMIVLALSTLFFKGFNQNVLLNVVSILRFIILLCAILPISLRVNLEISKTINSHLINKNSLFPKVIVRNSTIPEELGRIGYILTDKTGTLTKNEMIFREMAFENSSLRADNPNEVINIIEKCLQHTKFGVSFSPDFASSLNSNISSRRNTKLKKMKGADVIEALTALCLCNTVTPVKHIENGGHSHEQFDYHASSPDELALVNYAKTMKFTLIERDDFKVSICDPQGEKISYDILACFPYSSESKRMGILLRDRKSQSIVFYTKGSEDVIAKRAKSEYRACITEKTESLAEKGLRTLVFAKKVISVECYEKWNEEFSEALTSIEKRKESIMECLEKLEQGSDFLCITGVEDNLQEQVLETIESLKSAGLKIWMLTGDKIETAACVAISTGIKKKTDQIFFIKDKADSKYVEESLTNLAKLKGHSLIIDGKCLEVALNLHEKLFFASSQIASSVVFCRCSPTQKAKIVNLLKKYTHDRILTVGDGGNDVGMIQEAHCGVGVEGKEGRQASLAADYSVTEFHHLKFLLLWFGRQSFKNTAKICHFVIQRGMILAIMQYIFCTMLFYFPIPLYNGILVMGYTSIYTNFPVCTLLLDRDTEIKNVMKFPLLYKNLRKGRELNLKSFLIWAMISIFQASVIMFGTIYLFKDKVFEKLITITFSNLIFAELLNISSQIKHFHRLMIFTLLGTIITYICTLFFLDSVLDYKYAFQPWNLFKIISISFVNWFPVFVYFKIREKYFPKAHEKLNKINIKSFINTK